MAFLFKSKKGQERAPASRDGMASAQAVMNPAVGKVPSHARATPTGSLNSIENEGSSGSPDKVHRRGGSVEQPQQSDLPFRNHAQQMSNSNASLYPWSQRRLTYTSGSQSPFPRYGAAVNSVSSKEGDVYMMGGLINSSTVKGDLWMIEAGSNMSCYPIATAAEGPGPRVGHSSLLVGNAFIVYGGDTKVDESDVLDETLYLLNTSTRQWSRALPAGPRPSGRYGHTLNILGSKIYIFGGQVEGLFMNDLSAFDLNQLQMPSNRWEILLKGESPSPNSKVPAPRTNHSMITHNDKMYLFGGTNGFQWFNDVWCYDPAINRWASLDCIGYIPAPREGHAAALVDDVMYVFGGRTEEGTDLGDLAAFKISTRRWYIFQNMGPSPSPRSGHSMTTVGKSIVVVGGEPSSTTASTNDLGLLYVLDTTKIRYPGDGQQTSQKTIQGNRGPVNDVNGASRQIASRDGPPNSLEPRRLVSPNGSKAVNGPKYTRPISPAESSIPGTASSGTRLPRAAPGAGPAGPPPSAPAPAKPPGDPALVGRVRAPSADRTMTSLPSGEVDNTSSPAHEAITEEQQPPSGRKTPTSQLTRSGSKQEGPSAVAKASRQGRSQGSLDSTAESSIRPPATRSSSPPPGTTRQTSNPMSRRSSQRNSQTVVLLKELDAARNRNAWYASELELARKAGYVPNTSTGLPLDVKAAETFDEEDRLLIEALLAMRTDLANVQSAIDKQAVTAARQIAEVEHQRDAAVQEAVNAKAKLAAQTSGASHSLQEKASSNGEPSEDPARRLGSTLQAHKELQSRLEAMRLELESEKRARQLADDTTSAAQKRMGELESYKQQTSAELERLKSELHLSQREAREHSVTAANATSSLELLKVEKDDYCEKLKHVTESTKDHDTTFESLRSAITASQDARSHLERKLETSRVEREELEAKYHQLKAEHDGRTAELSTAQQRLRDAEEIAEKHAEEAKTHRQAVLEGLSKMSTRDAPRSGGQSEDRLVALQNQVNTANALVKRYQEEADAAADKLRSAEERIAGLEQYQEQSSREGVSIRRQLQSALRDTQSLQAAHSDIKNQLAAQQLETNAMTVQHNALKGILSERGISPSTAERSRSASNLSNSSPDLNRLRELEMQLANATAAHEDSKQAFATQSQESESAYRDKLSQLESDYQSAVHYVRGTEKMLKQLKEQSSRYKQDITRLKAELATSEERLQAMDENSGASPGGEAERSQLESKIQALESEVRSGAEAKRSLEALRQELSESVRQRDAAIATGQDASNQLEHRRKELDQLQSENNLLEQRAQDAEQKVSLLLDQVEHSVDNCRRQSRQVPGLGPEHTGLTNGSGLGHTRNESSEDESVYGANGLDARNSAALDNLASELETLRSHWEATNKNYRLSTNLDFEPPSKARKDDESGLGLSESLADWRQRLDTEDLNNRDRTKLG